MQNPRPAITRAPELIELRSESGSEPGLEVIDLEAEVIDLETEVNEVIDLVSESGSELEVDLGSEVIDLVSESGSEPDVDLDLEVIDLGSEVIDLTQE